MYNIQLQFDDSLISFAILQAIQHFFIFQDFLDSKLQDTQLVNEGLEKLYHLFLGFSGSYGVALLYLLIL